MNKKVVLVVAAVALMAFGCGKKVSNTNQQNNDQTQKTQGQQSFKQLAADSKPKKCEVSYSLPDSNVASQGTMYVANGKMRGDFTAQSQGQTMAMHMVVQDNTIYNWSDGQTTGFKMSMNGSSTTTAQNSVNLDQSVSYTCEDWREDSSMFSLPSNVTFQDPSAMMVPPSASGSASGSGSAGVNTAAMCAACDNAPDATSKAQCKAALGCK